MTKIDRSTLVFDIGKTHVKVTLLNEAGQELYKNRTSNTVKQDELYDSYDEDRIWEWLLNELSTLTPKFNISAISIATHGAAAALVNSTTGDLLLPIMDYEFDSYPDNLPDYGSLRPPFDITGSPEFPGGLNLGRQLLWQSQLLSDADKENAVLLLYPQYWAWRLTGKFSSEITSLGCHTDLWDIRTNSPSSLLKELGLENALPPLVKAWESLGVVEKNLAVKVGLAPDCAVYPGVHDSNAGYLSILKIPASRRPTVVSSGTWTVIMDSQTDLASLDKGRDMLVNIDASATPLATARYMGGREFGLICERLNTDIATTFSDNDIHRIIDTNTLVLPGFCDGTGPYPEKQGQIVFEDEHFPINGKAAATIYSALMVNNIVKRLTAGSTRDILVEGSFAANEVLCGLLAALNPDRTVRIQNQGNGVTEGCFLLTRWNASTLRNTHQAVTPYPLDTFISYAQTWESRLTDT